MKTTFQPPGMSTNALSIKYDLLAEMKISLSGYFYAVDFGATVRPRYHYVDAQGVCSCDLAENCPSVEGIRDYLAAGGARAPEPLPGYYPTIPARCPICGASVSFDPHLSSKQRGAGWHCDISGSAHYWKSMGQALAKNFARKRAGRQEAATDVGPARGG